MGGIWGGSCPQPTPGPSAPTLWERPCAPRAPRAPRATELPCGRFGVPHPSPRAPLYLGQDDLRARTACTACTAVPLSDAPYRIPLPPVPTAAPSLPVAEWYPYRCIYCRNAQYDFLDSALATFFARAYAGGQDMDHPKLSPVNADLTGSGLSHGPWGMCWSDSFQSRTALAEMSVATSPPSTLCSTLSTPSTLCRTPSTLCSTAQGTPSTLSSTPTTVVCTLIVASGRWPVALAQCACATHASNVGPWPLPPARVLHGPYGRHQGPKTKKKNRSVFDGNTFFETATKNKNFKIFAQFFSGPKFFRPLGP